MSDTKVLTPEQIAELRRLERAWHDAPDHTLERTGAKAEYEMCIRNAAPALLDAAERCGAHADELRAAYDRGLADGKGPNWQQGYYNLADGILLLTKERDAAIARAEAAEKAERARVVAWLDTLHARHMTHDEVIDFLKSGKPSGGVMNVDECYAWLAAKKRRAVDPIIERMVQRLVDEGCVVWMPRQRVASSYHRGRTRRFAKVIGPRNPTPPADGSGEGA